VASLEDGQCLRITCAHALDQVDIADFRKKIAHGATAYVVFSGMATLCRLLSGVASLTLSLRSLVLGQNFDGS
jgi:hypothetical protein